MSWGELSCEYISKCPNPDCAFETCNIRCSYYKPKEPKPFLDVCDPCNDRVSGPCHCFNSNEEDKD